MLDQVLSHAKNTSAQSLERLFELLRIESVSTDPAYKDKCRQAADWCARALSGIGIDASVRDTTGHPMVVGHGGKGQDGPHVLFYGHYDVQPPDPLDLWETPPFEPRLAKGANGQDIIVARGACDDKGQLMTFIEACRAWKEAAGELPVRVSVLIEGEEETGSPSLEPFLNANAGELKADLALICDTGMWNAETPAITTMLRGLVLEEVIVGAADRDLHSGMFGGAARNPIRVLARIIADIHDENGHIAIPGFYDGADRIPAGLQQNWNALKFDPADFLGGVGLSEPAGETDHSVLEQIWARPTCDVNGIVGGYTGKGSKTVIPAQASAKFSFRLVGEQDPEQIAENFRAFVRERLPADCEAEFIRHGADPAIAFSPDGAAFEKARAALDEQWGTEPALIGCGGSIPIVAAFRDTLGMDSLLIGFGLDDDRIHSPNEKYNLSSFTGGTASWIRILDALARD